MNSHQNLGQYIEKYSSEEIPILKKIYRETNIRMLNPRMVTGHIQGLFLTFISRILKPSLILEIGTYTGYSAICLALGLAPKGKLHTIEINDEISEIAKSYFNEAGLSNKIIQHIGDARIIIPQLNLKFDLIYIDGEKREYPDYYKISMKYLINGGYLLADNVLWDGKVLNSPVNSDIATKAIQKFNKLVHDDIHCKNFLLPLRDGIMVLRKE